MIRLEREEADLLVIGGGITGAGIALDAASRGLKVILVEKEDFASGTSSNSSKLIHGGFRYLKSRDFKLVFEALHERGLLLRLAPGLVEPLPFLIPVYNSSIRYITKLFLWLFSHEKTTMMELIKAPLALRISVALYDLLAGKQKIKKHKILSKSEVLRAEPMLSPEGLKGGAIYYDAFGLDFRLTLSVIKKACEHGARCLNYTEVVDFIKEGKNIVGARLRDKIKGREYEIFAKKIIIAVGPWADELRSKAGLKEKILRPSKGSHIIISREKLKINNAIVMEAGDGRLTFAIPWEDLVIIGTTDIEYDKSIDEVRATGDEVSYLLEIVNRYFPSAKISYKDIITTYSGVRPLIDTRSSSVGDVSREHRITEENGVITIAGGKLTTYRVMAKDVVDRITEKPCVTQEIKLKEQCEEIPFEVEEDIKNHLVKIYSKRDIEKMAGMIEKNEKLKERILPSLPCIWAEINLAAKHEFAVKLSDVMIRRLGIYFRKPKSKAIENIAKHMAKLLGWSDERTKLEIEGYLKEVEKGMEWKRDININLE